MLGIKDVQGMKSINDLVYVSSGDYYDVNLTLVVSNQFVTFIDTSVCSTKINQIRSFIMKHNLKLKNIILTHESLDHSRLFRLFKTDKVNLYEFCNTKHNQLIKMDDVNMRVLHTPSQESNKHLSVLINDEILVAGEIIVAPETLSPYSIHSKEALIDTLYALSDYQFSFIIPWYGNVCVGNQLLEKNLQMLTK